MTGTNLPKLAAPARRALEGAGIHRLEALSHWTRSDVAALHGMGPTAIEALSTALGQHDLEWRP